MAIKINTLPKDMPILNRELQKIESLQTQVSTLQGLPPVSSIPIITGSGSPEGKVIANIGTLYLRQDGGTSTTLYVKESGTQTNIGWVAK